MHLNEWAAGVVRDEQMVFDSEEERVARRNSEVMGMIDTQIGAGLG